MKNRKFPGTEKEARKCSPTELLILALISYGHATTLYALQKETLLSAGALVPALTKLKADGLIQAESVGPRRRQQFRVGAVILKRVERKTEQTIKENWNASAQAHMADCDAVLKLCKAGEIFDLPEAVEYAHSAAEFRASELRKYTNQEGRVEAPEIDPFSYRSYRDVARFYQLQAEEHTLRAVEAALKTDL
jgi:DNA-binding PadR family transcriptional regulator